MKVILLMDVARLGRRHEVKEVPDGHAINFLIPRKLAIPATNENMMRLRERMRKAEADKAHEDEALHETLSKLKETVVEMKVSANEQGHLFKGIKPEDVAAYVSKNVGVLHAEHMSLKTPLKEVGEYTIDVTAGKQHGSFILKLVKE